MASNLGFFETNITAPWALKTQPEHIMASGQVPNQPSIVLKVHAALLIATIFGIHGDPWEEGIVPVE
jgi:hypothetical protein